MNFLLATLLITGFTGIPYSLGVTNSLSTDDTNSHSTGVTHSYSTGVTHSDHDGFGYDEGDPLGPDHWPEKYKKCAGKYQSPIDIEESLVTRVSLPPLSMTGFYGSMKSAKITNNGHTVMFTANFSEPVTLSGGPLTVPSYKFAQLHFHWGMNDSLGSEDLINNHSYPMELHMVFYNEDYNNTETAQQYFDGLVVLAYFFEISPGDNPAYTEIVNSLAIINEPYYSAQLRNVSHLASFLPTNLDNYFTYTGSLTTPPCSEGVRWIDFKHPVKLSHAQLEKFRTLHSNGGVLTHNFRPVQPLSSRPVWYNSGSPTSLKFGSDTDKQKGGSPSITISTFLLFVCVLLMVPSIRL